MLSGNVVFVGTPSTSPFPRRGPDHGLCRLTFRPPRRMRGARIYDQAVTILDQQMAHIAKPRRLALGLAIQPGVRIGDRGMGVVAARLTMEIAFRVAAWSVRRVIPTVLAPKTFHRSPGVDQRAIHRKMLSRKQRLDRWIAHYRQQEPNRHIARH